MQAKTGLRSSLRSKKLDRAFYRYNVYVEMKVAKSKDDSAFYKLILKALYTLRISRNNEIPGLVNYDGELVFTPNAKADLLGVVLQKTYAQNFEESLIVNGGEYLPRFPQTNASLWFHRKKIIEVLFK